MQEVMRNKAHELVDFLYQKMKFPDIYIQDDIRQEIALIILEKMKESDIEAFYFPDGTLNISYAHNKFYGMFKNIRANLETKAYAQRIVPDYAVDAANLETVDSQIPAMDMVEEEEPSQQDTDLALLKQKLVHWALSQLLPRHRNMLLYIAEGGSIRLYAEANDLEYNAAKRLWGRAKTALKKTLEQVVTQRGFLESGKMSPDLFQMISTSPYSQEIHDTVISQSSRALPGNIYVQHLQDPVQSRSDSSQPSTVHSLDETEEL